MFPVSKCTRLQKGCLASSASGIIQKLAHYSLFLKVILGGKHIVHLCKKLAGINVIYSAFMALKMYMVCVTNLVEPLIAYFLKLSLICVRGSVIFGYIKIISLNIQFIRRQKETLDVS